MPKSANSLPRILTMVAFALSCFGLLLFLWLSFGGPIPLKPQGYRFQVAFPEATQLGLEADVRIAGVSVGKVRKKDLGDGNNRTLVDIEVDREFAPVGKATRAILRQKTILGETYVELIPGRGGAGLPEGGRLPDGQVADAVQLDEIFEALDPQTRASFRTWQQDMAKGIAGRGRDFNDALGTLPGFAHDGRQVLEVLDVQERAVGRLVKNTGTVFGALTENESQLRNLITSSAQMFDATARQDEALAEMFRIFPTFLDESRATVDRLKTFSIDTRPLIQDLRPVARDVQPTLKDLRAMAPDLRDFFSDLEPLIAAGREGLPASAEIFRGLEPVLGELRPFLAELNPILFFLEANQWQVADFISYGGAATQETTASPGGGVGHYLRQFGPTGAESVAIHRERLKTNRGNSYLPPLGLWGPNGPTYMIGAQNDCRPSGGERPASADQPGCWVAKPFEVGGRLQSQIPRLQRDGGR